MRSIPQLLMIARGRGLGPLPAATTVGSLAWTSDPEDGLGLMLIALVAITASALGWSRMGAVQPSARPLDSLLLTTVVLTGGWLVTRAKEHQRQAGREAGGVGTAWSRDRDLEAILTEVLETEAQLGRRRARRLGHRLWERVKADARQDGTAELAAGGGDRILAHEARGLLPDRVRAELHRLRAEGVEDEDIRRWWNLSDLERRLLVAVDAAVHDLVLRHHQHSGLTMAQSARQIRHRFPHYAARAEPADAGDLDRPLPYELKLRVNRYVERQLRANPAAFQARLETSSSFNALIRTDVWFGRL